VSAKSAVSHVEALEVVQSKLREAFVAAGFITEINTLDVKLGLLLIVIATKPSL
jgi:hypothetical protein